MAMLPSEPCVRHCVLRKGIRDLEHLLRVEEPDEFCKFGGLGPRAAGIVRTAACIAASETAVRRAADQDHCWRPAHLVREKYLTVAGRYTAVYRARSITTYLQ